MIFASIIILALIVVIVYFYLRQRKEKRTGYGPYVEALSAILEGNDDLAIKKLIETVNADSDLIDAYVRLGDMYRKKGDISKAIQVHQSLTVRAILKKQIEKKVYYALVSDFLQINRPNKAISFLKEIIKIDKNDQQAMHMMLKIYEDIEDYGGCISIYEDRNFKPKDENRLAFYYASSANNRLKNLTVDDTEGAKEAHNSLRKALKTSPNSLTALYYLGNYYIEKEDWKRAKEYYLKIVTYHPDHFFLILPKFEKVYFELGSFDKILPLYDEIFQKNPQNFAVGFALADLYEKKNDAESAKYVYRRLTEKYPKNIRPKIYLIKALTKEKTVTNEIDEIEKYLKHSQFRCKKCGYETKEFALICAKCHVIESYLPYL